MNDSPLFRPLPGVFEPSAVQQLADGRFLVVEDEKAYPLSVFRIDPDGAVETTALPVDGWELDDLEGLAADSAGRLYAITSHSRDGDGDEQQALTYYKRSLEDEPDHAGANFFLAYQEMTADNCQMAAERFARVVRQTPENIVAVRSEILCRWQSGSSEAALLASIDHALIRHRDDPELSAWRIRLLATATDPRVRDPHTALKAGEKLYESTARPDVLEALAMAQAANGYYEKAAASQDVVVGQMMMFGAFDILPPAEARLERYRQGLPAESAWLPDDPVFRAPPVDVDGAFRHYPMDMAY